MFKAKSDICYGTACKVVTQDLTVNNDTNLDNNNNNNNRC